MASGGDHVHTSSTDNPPYSADLINTGIFVHNTANGTHDALEENGPADKEEITGIARENGHPANTGLPSKADCTIPQNGHAVNIAETDYSSRSGNRQAEMSDTDPAEERGLLVHADQAGDHAEQRSHLVHADEAGEAVQGASHQDVDGRKALSKMDPLDLHNGAASTSHTSSHDASDENSDESDSSKCSWSSDESEGHTCLFCKTKFDDSSQLEEHKKCRSCIVIYKCVICNKTFRQKAIMKIHINTHWKKLGGLTT